MTADIQVVPWSLENLHHPLPHVRNDTFLRSPTTIKTIMSCLSKLNDSIFSPANVMVSTSSPTSAAFSASTSSRFGILIQKDSWGPTSLKQKPFSETSNSSNSNTISPEIFEKSMYTWTFKGVPIEPFGMVN